MKNIILNILVLLISISIGYYSLTELTNIYSDIGIFLSGFLFCLFIMKIKLNAKNDKINSFKRELEKESICENNATSRVKVLESKIEVLEKALENALKK
ncbi:MAG: hypothetical protein MJ237_02860 [bacterium]|nr:hypothetical protein [bacterium]